MGMLGMMAVVSGEHITFTFSLICFFMILIARLVSVAPLTFLLNRCRKRKISWQYMCVIWLSGLRGAIAVTLALDIPSAMRDQLTAATVILSIVTVFLFGGTTSATLSILNITTGIEKQQKKISLHSTKEIFKMSGWKYFDNRYLKPCLIKAKYLAHSTEGTPQDLLDGMMEHLHQEEIEKSKLEFDNADEESVIMKMRSHVNSILVTRDSHYQSVAGKSPNRDANRLSDQQFRQHRQTTMFASTNLRPQNSTTLRSQNSNMGSESRGNF